MKKAIDVLLLIAVIVPVVLLFWPFVIWSDAMSLILRIIPSFAVQVLLCKVERYNILKVMPLVLTGVFALWGTYLYFTSSHWSNATWGDLIVDYVSPFICCAVALGGVSLAKKSE